MKTGPQGLGFLSSSRELHSAISASQPRVNHEQTPRREMSTPRTDATYAFQRSTQRLVGDERQPASPSAWRRQGSTDTQQCSRGSVHGEAHSWPAPPQMRRTGSGSALAATPHLRSDEATLVHHGPTTKPSGEVRACPLDFPRWAGASRCPVPQK